MLYGRGAEQAAIDRLLAAAAQEGRSGALVLRGEAGIGKTALLRYAAETAEAAEAAGPGFRILRAAGVETESELPFAGLNLLLAAGADRVPALPGPQRRALEGVFGLAEPAAGDRLLIGLATLGLLAELAAEQPLLCLVDDAQWLDAASAEALLIAARRLRSEGVVLLFTARDGGISRDGGTSRDSGTTRDGGGVYARDGGAAYARDGQGVFAAPGLPELRLAGLDSGASAELLRAAGVAEQVRLRVLVEAQGNPLALTELPAALATEQPGAVGGIPLTGRLQLAFHGRITRLPAATQTLLLAAAVEESGELAVVLRAAAALGAPAESLGPAEEAGVVGVSEERRIVFRHPLLRAAVLQRVPVTQRIAAHRAVGEALDPGDRDRRTWHLALAATGPEAGLADALEESARRAEARGGHAGAATAYERAARLTPDRDGATRRLVLAAESATEAGELDRAAGLAEQARGRTADPRALALIDHIRAVARFWRGDRPGAYRLLLDAAGTDAADLDPQQAARMLFLAFHLAWYLGEGQLGDVLDRLGALGLPEDGPTGTVARYLRAVALPLLDRPAPRLPTGEEALAACLAAGQDPVTELLQLCGATLILGRDEETGTLAAELTARARARGAAGALPTLLFFQAEAELFHGRHRDAEATAEEGLALARDTGQTQWAGQLAAVLAWPAALAGDEERCTGLVALAHHAPGPGPAAGRPWAMWSLGLLDLGRGRAADAADRLAELTTGEHRHHVSGTRSVPDLVEAVVRLGQPERAEEPYRRFARWVEAAGRPWARALLLRCQALLGPEELAEDAYLAALALHRECERPFEQARTALLFGEWLRRERRRTDARTHLRSALEAFELLGAHPWAERARTELTATGVGAPAARAAGPLAVLTPQELQIVRLAAVGQSNRDIAAQLFLSPRTVGHHLYKAFPKLGVASRAELAALL